MTSSLVRRNASLSDMVTLLREQDAAKIDIVIPCAGVRSAAGVWEVAGTGPAVLDPDGVTTGSGRFCPTASCDAGMADKLGIPTEYLRRLRAEHVPLYDVNVDGWLERQPERSLLLRLLRGAADGDGGGGGEGVARAVLSQRYRFVDNLDVLLAVLDGVRVAGADVRVGRCDLTERRMYV